MEFTIITCSGYTIQSFSQDFMIILIRALGLGKHYAWLEIALPSNALIAKHGGLAESFALQ